jgi:glycosyltransferase involved in cell wall biosynthesis
MKVSIILAVYNGEDTLKECLKALARLEYPKENFELVIVNDGSKDKTSQIIEKFVENKKEIVNVKYLDLVKNQGRIIARLKGVEASSYGNLLFIDHRGTVHKDILKCLEEKNYQPIIGNLYQEKEGNLVGNFFYVLRKIIYFPYWGDHFEDVYITKDNFNEIAKGFCPFFCEKELLVKNLPKERGKNVNDDTRIFKKIVEERDILKTSSCKVFYSERGLGKDFLQHIFNRGPRFVDFYLTKGSKFLIPILFLLISPLIIFIVLFLPGALFFLVGLLFVLLSIFLLRYQCTFGDCLSVFLIGPIVWFVFVVGLWKGVFLKSFRRQAR